MEDKPDKKAEEPEVAYNKKKITFFNSFEEMENHRYKILGSLSFEERLTQLEILRERMFYEALLPNGTWPVLSRKLTIIKLPYAVCK